MPPFYRHRSSMCRRLASFAVFEVFRILLDAQDLRNFFLCIDDDSGLFELVLQSLGFTFQLGDALGKGILGFAFRPRFLGVKPLSRPSSRCLRQVVRCEEYSPCLAQQRPNFTGLGALVGLLENAQLVGSGESSPGYFFRHFRIGRGQPTVGDRQPWGDLRSPYGLPPAPHG